MIFSDDCKIDFGSDNGVFIWGKVGEEWLACCLAPTPKDKVRSSLTGWLGLTPILTIFQLHVYTDSLVFLKIATSTKAVSASN